jgi:hypothetical protein
MSPRFLIQLSFFNSVETSLFLNLAFLNKDGANSLGAAQWSHLAFQNGVTFPSPMQMYVEAKTRALSVGSFSQSNFF